MKKKYKPTSSVYDSAFEEKFHELWKQYSPYPIVTHHSIHLSRNWEMDFCFPEAKVCIELQGYGVGHATYSGMKRDFEKHNDLVLAGWIVLYFMSAHLNDDPKKMIHTIKTVLGARNVRKEDLGFESGFPKGRQVHHNPIFNLGRRVQNKRPNQ